MKFINLALLVMSMWSCTFTAAFRLVCYFPNWAKYRPGQGKFTVDNVDPKLCTHLIYSFAILDSNDYTIRAIESESEIKNGGYSKFNALKSANAGKLKTMIALGGWADSQTGKYSQLISAPNRITTFVDSVVTFLKLHKFDGLDVDWEFPKSATGKAGFTSLLKALRSAFNRFGFILSVAVSITPSVVDAGYDVPAIEKYVDFVNLMAYDIHGSWETRADHHSPLYKRSGDTTDSLNVDLGVTLWLKKGLSAGKLNLGIPMYGRTWMLSSDSIKPNSPASGPGPAGPFTAEAGSLAYYEICNYVRIDGWRVVRDSNSLIGPYAVSPTDPKIWVSFDDSMSVVQKSAYIRSKKLGGAMVWDISQDDFANICRSGTYPLIKRISRALLDIVSAKNSMDVITTSTSKPLNNTSKTTSSSTKTTKSNVNDKITTKRPETKTKTVASSIATKLKTNCPKPNGLYSIEDDCNSFNLCWSGVGVRMQCPKGLYFNKVTSVCDWSINVECKSRE